ncbi:ATP-binding cassette domain-containing protein [Microbacterium sp. NPDC058342]|uniref:ATP-binding cassette domain-containing protein n=1 Tax=Microbacterium sp. NPDC058342 TaxID=3346454 RepID=UPI0036576EEC
MTEDGTQTRTPMLRASRLVKEFGSKRGPLQRRAGFRAVDDVSFTVDRGETLALVGESGSGKSTTARLIARLLDPTSGSIEFEGVEVSSLAARQLRPYRSQVQVVFQDPFSSLNPKHSAEQIITAPRRHLGLPMPTGASAFARDLMARVGLDPDHSTRRPAQFSGGQAQRIGIARALAVSPKLIICDEAVSALDVSVQAQVINLLKRLQAEEGFAYVFIAHDLAVVRQIATRVAVMSQGRIVESGERDAVFDAPRHPYTRELLAAVPRIDPEWDAHRRANSPFAGQEAAA